MNLNEWPGLGPGTATEERPKRGQSGERGC